MKISPLVTYLIMLLTLPSINAQETTYHCLWENCGYQPGEKVYVFGNDVKLRTAPNTDSTVLQLLKIGEWVEILEITAASWPYQGFDSPFYKVRYDDMTGYIIGGLLALERKTLNGENYFFAYAKEGEHIFLNIRKVANGLYSEYQVALANTTFGIETYDDKGLNGLDGILFIDYYAEACGSNGGGIYFFVQNDELLKVAQLTEASDSGLYWYAEKFIFPNDEGGIPKKILYKKEKGEVYDEDSNWIVSSSETRELRWIDGKLSPNYNEKITN
ncbi:MAG: SH3 domain-containing protein [Bacteroidota bacterium]